MLIPYFIWLWGINHLIVFSPIVIMSFIKLGNASNPNKIKHTKRRPSRKPPDNVNFITTIPNSDFTMINTSPIRSTFNTVHISQRNLPPRNQYSRKRHRKWTTSP